MKALPVGYDDFSEVIEKNLYYVDKTFMIRDLIKQGAKVNLFTRPRRFGKTLNMSMLQYFFEDGWDIAGKKMEYRHLFDGLEIASCGEEYMKHQGQYPVIFLTLKGAKQDTWEESFDAIKKQLASEYDRHAYILENGRLERYKKRFERIMMCEEDKSGYNDALAFLVKCLYTCYGKKVILLIDEYDVPLETAYLNGFYDRMVGFIRSLFESALKTNPYLEFAVLTGCLRVSKESIFTGMKNLKIYSILNEQYSGYFGFTDQEVLAMCEYYGLDKHYERIKEWYNGYRFGDTNVYNPWSVILQVDEYLSDLEAFPEAHWANSSSNSIVREMINRADRDTKDEIEQMIHGMQLEKPVHEDITYGEIYEKIENLWNFMFFTGYFKMESMRIEKRQRYVTLSIPNEEVRYIFESKIRDWFHEEVVNGDRTVLLRAFFGSDGETFQRELDRVLKECISYHDYYENFYHGVLTGILSGTKDYVVRSNREGGNGRNDLYKKIVHYGIAFFGKDCLVKVAPADGAF
ncbi:MAG: AAA family ATPase [Lachnospiraceae bacterium]|nr:AAA family ATPase [Lachnospiraceae bacterium]